MYVEEKKCAFMFFGLYLYFFFLYFLKKVIYGQIKPFYHKSETTFSKQVFLNFFSSLSIRSSRMSRNLHKLRLKLRNAKLKKKIKLALLPHMKR